MKNFSISKLKINRILSPVESAQVNLQPPTGTQAWTPAQWNEMRPQKRRLLLLLLKTSCDSLTWMVSLHYHLHPEYRR